LKKRNIKYYFVILPTKFSVYPEYLRDDITRLYNNTLTDQFIEAFNGKAPFAIIDTRKALIEAKKYNIRLFQKTDSHWNYAGAYFAYHYISEYLKKDFPEIKTRELEEYNIDSTLQKGGDISRMLGNDELYKETMIMLKPKIESGVKIGKEAGYDPKGFSLPEEYEIVWENPKYKKPRGLIIRDSFTGYMVPYLKEDFSKSVFIFDRWEYGLHEDMIEHEKPDVVINIVLECHIKNILKNMSYDKENQLNKK
jgi:alginate O-acetyltransferase complex protein AlgJ